MNNLHVHINMTYDAVLPVSQFNMMQQIVEAMQNAGVNVTATVDTVDSRRPPTSGASTPTTRGRRKSNGTSVAPPAPTPEDVAGDDDPQDEGDDVGLEQPALSPEEALEQGLGYTRHLFNAQHKDAINDMRKQLGVKKFTELEAKDGPRLLKLAEEWAQRKGLRV